MATTDTTAPAEFHTGFFSSPDDLLTAAKLANQTVTAIDGAVSAAGAQVPDNTSTAWLSFKAVWDGFFKDHFQGQNITEEWLFSDLEGQLRTFEGKIADWGSTLSSLGVQVPGGVPQPESTGLPDWLPSGGTVIAVGLIILGTVIAWRVL